SPASTAPASSRGRDGILVTTTRPLASSIAVRSVNVPPTSIPIKNMAEMISKEGNRSGRCSRLSGGGGRLGCAAVGGGGALPVGPWLARPLETTPPLPGAPQRAPDPVAPQRAPGGGPRPPPAALPARSGPAYARRHTTASSWLDRVSRRAP